MRRLFFATLLAAAGLVLAACGSEGISVPEDDPDHAGAVLFAERCSGCHTMKAAGTQGSGERELRVQGPNFDERFETFDDALFAIRNGGFSGAIMPQNIVVGEDAEAVARFLANWSGDDVEESTGPGASGEFSSGAEEEPVEEEPAEEPVEEEPAEEPVEEEPAEEEPSSDTGADAQLGEQVYNANGCAGCHVLEAAGSTGEVGPNLDDVLPGMDAAEILASIIDPDAVITAGFTAGVMPADYGELISQEELDALVAFLLQSTSP